MLGFNAQSRFYLFIDYDIILSSRLRVKRETPGLRQISSRKEALYPICGNTVFRKRQSPFCPFSSCLYTPASHRTW